jgi:hypothetical protein
MEDTSFEQVKISRVSMRCLAAKHVVTGAHGHHHFFKRGITGALAQAVDGAFDLASTVHDRRQGIGDRQALSHCGNARRKSPCPNWVCA